MSRDRADAVLIDDEQFHHVLNAARNDAGWAFEQLFHHFAPPVRGYLRAQGAVEPDELTNDVFLSAFRALDRFDGGGSAFRAWLFTIARNRLIDEHRRQTRRITTVPTDTALRTDEAGGDVETEALSNLRDEWAIDILRQLAPDQCDVLLLRIVCDLTINQIAQILGKRPGAVKALQRRGLSAVRRLLDEQGVPLARPADV
jgi:RNA polymerase sigma-70 factor (ECF subfamily)